MAVINLRTRATPARGPIARARRPGHIPLAVVAGLIAVAGVLAGCGTAATPSAGSTSSASSHAAAAKATLTIKVADKAAGTVTHWTLRCDPAGGTAPDPAAACKTLFGAKDTLTTPRRQMMCPTIMVSDKQIVVDGSWFGKKVHRVIIDGGCDLATFNSLAKTFD